MYFYRYTDKFDLKTLFLEVYEDKRYVVYKILNL